VEREPSARLRFVTEVAASPLAVGENSKSPSISGLNQWPRAKVSQTSY
jgi:hypothetical protein